MYSAIKQTRLLFGVTRHSVFVRLVMLKMCLMKRLRQQDFSNGRSAEPCADQNHIK